MNYLKNKKVFIESLGEEIEIRQLSAKAQVELMAAYKGGDMAAAGFISLKYGVPAWSAFSVEEISNNLSMAQANEINDAIGTFSTADEKNSESTPAEPSSLN